ncbi:hypothetical protein Cni_G13472 [Canna indica]|uniref:Uncharacterized protein n=1 Tax=Canna indica TaxID=4628 RepID=A0AAQ3KA63_9LILI|nr:hypothetical protein Cni_G13472 [Canna indica]
MKEFKWMHALDHTSFAGIVFVKVATWMELKYSATVKVTVLSWNGGSKNLNP